MPAKTLRARYMDHTDDEIDFHTYYGALVEHIGEDALRRLLPLDRTPEGWQALLDEDRHLNNVPLGMWDAKDAFMRSLVRADDAFVAITGTRGWALSDTVCVLKETARRYAATVQKADA